MPSWLEGYFGRAIRFEFATGGDDDALLGAHLAGVRSICARYSTSAWLDGALTSGWAFSGLLTRAVIALPSSLLSNGRAIHDTVGAQSTAPRRAARSLRRAASRLFVLDGRADALDALLIAARATGLFRACADYAAWAAKPVGHPPQFARVALVFQGDKHLPNEARKAFRPETIHPLSPRCVPSSLDVSALRDTERQIKSSSLHVLRGELLDVVRVPPSLCEEVIKRIAFLAVYPQCAFGHAQAGMPPPVDSAHAAMLREVCGMDALVAWIEGGDYARVARRASLRAAAAALSTCATSIRACVRLGNLSDAERQSLASSAALVIPPLRSVIDIGDGGSEAVAASSALCVPSWAAAAKAQLVADLKSSTVAAMQSRSTAALFGARLARFAPGAGSGTLHAGVGARPPSRWADDCPARCALGAPLTALMRHGEYLGTRLHEVMASPVFDWEVSPPPMPATLVVSWLRDAASALKAHPSEVSQIVALFRAATEGMYSPALAAAERARDARLSSLLRAALDAARCEASAMLRARFSASQLQMDVWDPATKAAEKAASLAVAQLTETLRKSKQAAVELKSERKSESSTKLVRLERRVPSIAAAACDAFLAAAAAAGGALLDAAAADVVALVTRHVGALHALTPSSVVAFVTTQQLWPALAAVSALTQLTAWLRILTEPCGDAAAGTASTTLYVARLPSLAHAARLCRSWSPAWARRARHSPTRSGCPTTSWLVRTWMPRHRPAAAAAAAAKVTSPAVLLTQR